ncbi:globin [Actinorhabdospora filicis]|uniref:Globin n=1 Tax=Actinorhabdospora filicis TaxID=1785913 RepID=A0A9W6SNS1_9ACTN|nr:group II truncated hemoglobin [Actinorhabdospora filicis]GLZ79363.1 globin [Actinorhabdospora filicis]
MTEQTIYEFIGGRDKLAELAEAHYRRCTTDPELSKVFGTTPRPQHAAHLADWLTEVFGGPEVYTEKHGGHQALLRHHAGKHIPEEARAAFVTAFIAAADEVGVSDDPHLRKRLVAYLEWGTAIAKDVSNVDDPEVLVSDQPVPKWGWRDEESPA